MESARRFAEVRRTKSGTSTMAQTMPRRNSRIHEGTVCSLILSSPGSRSRAAPVWADLMRELVSALSTHPAVLAWMATDDLIGSLATTIDRLAQGRSPARDLAALRPRDGFTSMRRNAVTQVDPKSYSRYTPIAQAIASVDATRAAELYERIRPRLDEAWRAQGHPEGGLDDAVRRALATVTTTPDIPADAALVPAAGGLKYADPAYEQLPEAQKHLARMGPVNVQLVRDAARRLGAAVDARRRAP